VDVCAFYIRQSFTVKENPMKTIATALLSLMVCAAPASANYFFNSQWGTMLNVGSAPNPTPDQLRAIGDTDHGRDVRRSDQPVSIGSASAEPTNVTVIPTRAAVVPASTNIIPVRTNASPREEPRITAQLNRASLIQARAIASDASAVKTTKTAAAKNNKKALKAAADAKSAKKSRV
jgi:hypothetical protein